MIALQTGPDNGSQPARRLWVALMFARQLAVWRPLSTHDSPLAAGRACTEAFQASWRDIADRARHMRALAEHPEVADFKGEGIDGAMLARWARSLSRAIEFQNEIVARLLDEPHADDKVELDGEPYKLDAAPRPDETEDTLVAEGALTLLVAIHSAPEHAVAALCRVLEISPTGLPLELLPLVASLARADGALSKAWRKSLPAFMREAYRLRASRAAIEEQPVGSYRSFCAQVLADSPESESIAFRLLARRKPETVAWPDYLNSLLDMAQDLEKGRDEGILYFGDNRSDTTDIEAIRTAQGLAHVIAEYLGRTGDRESSMVATLIFLSEELVAIDGPLPPEAADELFTQAVVSAVQRINEHHGTLISIAGIERASHAAHQTLRELAERDGVVLQPIGDHETPTMTRPRASDDASVADVIPFVSDADDDDAATNQEPEDDS